jgi:acyl carrier protein
VDALLRVNEVFRDVFEADDLSITRDTTAADVDGWDSLMHVRLVMAIEKEFGVRFTSSEVSSLGNVGDLLDVLERKAAARAGV